MHQASQLASLASPRILLPQVCSVIGPMLWVGITLGGTLTHILCKDPMPAIPFCGTVCLLNSVQLVLRLLYAGPHLVWLEPAYIYTPAAIIGGFLFLAFFGYTVKGRTDWEKKAALLSKEMTNVVLSEAQST